MSKFEKALARLRSRPKDFTWKELQTVMSRFGYEESKGAGSRRKFYNKATSVSISMHEPHPKPVLKSYAVELVLEHLKEEGYL